MEHLLFVFASASMQLVELAIKCQLHHCFKPNPDPQLRLASLCFPPINGSKERPIIYALVHCGPRGQTLKVSQLRQIIDTMTEYAKPRSKELAFAINHVNSQMHGHDWGKFKPNWENDKSGKKIENPRRYGAFTPTFNSANEEFTREMSGRLAVSDLQPDDRVP